MNTKPRFSVTLIAKNEEKSLPNLLASLKEFRERGGEILLVDTGSTDKTAEVAFGSGVNVHFEGDRFHHAIDEKLAAKINYAFIVEGEAPIVKAGDSYFDFGESRAYAMSLASNDWVLCPGCDEVFTKIDIDRIHGFMDAGNSQLRFDYIWSQNPDGTPKVRFYRDAYLFDRTKWHWIGCIHETVTENTAGEKWANLPEDVALVEHHQLPQEGRSNRDATGLAISCLNEPDNDRHAHYFARELMFQKRYLSAIRQFLRHVKLNKWDLERGQSLTFIGDCYWYMGDKASAVMWYHESFRFCAERRAPLMRLADLYFKEKDWRRATAYATAALTIPYLAFYANDMAHYTSMPHEILYSSLYWAGNIEGARWHWNECMKIDPNNSTYIIDGIKFFGLKVSYSPPPDAKV